MVRGVNGTFERSIDAPMNSTAMPDPETSGNILLLENVADISNINVQVQDVSYNTDLSMTLGYASILSQTIAVAICEPFNLEIRRRLLFGLEMPLYNFKKINNVAPKIVVGDTLAVEEGCNWDIVEKIGSGSFATLYLASDSNQNRAALKINFNNTLLSVSNNLKIETSNRKILLGGYSILKDFGPDTVP